MDKKSPNTYYTLEFFTMFDNNRYNGWANYETWLANLWLTNDYGLFSLIEETSQSIFEDCDNNSDEASIELANWLEDFTKTELIPELQGFAGDLLNSAVSEIDWAELALSYLSDLV